MPGMIDDMIELKKLFSIYPQKYDSVKKVLLWCISKEYIFKQVRDKNIICLLQD